MTKSFKLFFLSFLIFTLACSNDDGGGITEEDRQLVMGDDSGKNVVSLGLTSPIIFSRDDVHISLRELDINFDRETDITLMAFEEFGGNPKGLNLRTDNLQTRVALDENGNIKAFSEGDIVTSTSETWDFSDTLPLAVLNGQTTTGIWNGLQNQFVAVRIDIGNSKFLGWIELSVDNYDNYSFHNYAVKLIP